MLKLSSIDYLNALDQVKRRMGWFWESLTIRKAANITTASLHYILKNDRLLSWPMVVKIDVSPLCNLHCTICVHAYANGDPILEKQRFHPSMKMSFEQYKDIIDQIKGKSNAVSLYNLGDPLIHTEIDEMCQYARQAGLNVHINTNFSFKLSDERIRSIALSGVTHFTVCVDGMTQDTYSMTRVGGKIDLVKSNLERLCAFKKRHGLKYPIIEAQYLKFTHNLHQLSEAKEWLKRIGVDRMVDFYGTLYNYTVDRHENYTVFGPRKKKLTPLCSWPYFFMVIKYDGDVVPCCWYRIYSHNSSDPVDRSTVLGNVFETSVWDVWNSEKYRIARRLVSNPALTEKDHTFNDHYCYECPLIYETDWKKNHRKAPEWEFDDLYTLVEGRPVRRPEEESLALKNNRTGKSNESFTPNGCIMPL